MSYILDRWGRPLLVGWIIVFSAVVILALTELHNTQTTLKETQRDGRANRIAQDKALKTAQIISAQKLTTLQAARNEALKQGLVLVCTKSLGVITGIIALSVTGNHTHTQLTAAQKIAINAYIALANPKQCSTLVNPVK